MSRPYALAPGDHGTSAIIVSDIASSDPSPNKPERTTSGPTPCDPARPQLPAENSCLSLVAAKTFVLTGAPQAHRQR